jgi:hypothetical protein
LLGSRAYRKTPFFTCAILPSLYLTYWPSL